MTTTTDTIARLREAIGVQRGPTTWRTVSQEDVDAFAQITGDHQWIHVDVERAQRESPFGTTIAHGNLTLSLIYPSPVPTGSKVRATAELASVEEKGGGWWEVVDRFTVEVDGAEKPACVAESVGRILLRTDG
jgi:acyl dehydratase